MAEPIEYTGNADTTEWDSEHIYLKFSTTDTPLTIAIW